MSIEGQVLAYLNDKSHSTAESWEVSYNKNSIYEVQNHHSLFCPCGKVIFFGRHHPDSQEIQALG